jgi:hypothetical protein
LIVEELKPIYHHQKSFWKKAFTISDRGETTLYSYFSPVIKIDSGKNVQMLCSGEITKTTKKHIKEFRQQYSKNI